MFAFIVRRLLLMFPTTLGVALVVFTLYQLAPGDPATVMMGGGGASGAMEGGTDVEAKEDQFRRKHGLDRSPVVQFLDYIGPFNLSRDGHAWFTSPYTERKVEELELPGGVTVRTGRPLEIEHLPQVSPERAEELDALVETLVEEGSQEEWARASRALAETPEESLPPLFTALYRLRDSFELRGAALGRLIDAIDGCAEALGEPLPEAPPALLEAAGEGARVDQLFGWYYTDGGGYRVRNTGQDPWGGLLLFDLGQEMQADVPVAEELGRRLKVTVPLSLAAVLLSYALALPLGIFSARRQGQRIDNVTTVSLFVLYSIPQFWAGLMLILLFGVTGPSWFPNLPVLGLTDKDFASFSTSEKVWDVLKHSILPVVTLAYGGLAYLSRQMRAGVLDTIRLDYIRTARAKGLSDDVVVYKHVLRNSLIPVITLFASILPILIGGSIIVEQVFDIPGMGKYAFEGLLRRDFYIIMATTLFVGVMTQFGILLSDITYSLVDPRIRHD